MQVIIFTVCKHASVDKGLLSITGGASNLLVPEVPWRVRLVIATRLFFTAEEQGHFVGTFKLIDPDGHEIARAPIEVDVKIHEEDATGVFADSVGELIVTFRTSGEHQFHFEGPNQSPILIPFYVSRKSK